MIVWSFGGGVQSVGLAALIRLGRLPMPELIVIADTGREVETTWETVELMRERGFEIHIAPHSLASVDLYAHNGDLLIPAFTGHEGMLRTLCSNEWKQRVIRRWLRARGVETCELWLGISTDEAHRQKPSGLEWMLHVYPLCDLGINRKACHLAIAEVGWDQPAKSRCFMCPYQSEREWRELSGYDLARAIALDDDIRKNDEQNSVYIHRSRRPLREIDLTAQGVFDFGGCDSGYCWT